MRPCKMGCVAQRLKELCKAHRGAEQYTDYSVKRSSPRGWWSPKHSKEECWEISAGSVYPCIPDPDGEDDRGQASSLAVSTRWISAARLLQSDLATLAQREGGE
ncbi:hypothetical protein BHE74_00054043 [Ensete ventricosum]|nr:hypothetical protein BHE74_00054043 [Ensete ventricosum]